MTTTGLADDDGDGTITTFGSVVENSALLPMLRDRNLRVEAGDELGDDGSTGCISVIVERGGILMIVLFGMIELVNE